MPLSEYEQRVLAQMERQLSSDDPKLAQTFSGGPRRTPRIVLGAALAVAGLGALVGGVAQQMTWLGLVGFLMMFGGVLVAMSRSSAAGAAPGPAAPAAGAAPVKSAGRSTFMSRLDDRWDRRRSDGP